MFGTIKCKECKETWSSPVEDEEDTNACEVEICNCPACGSDNFEIVETFYDDPEPEWDTGCTYEPEK